MLADPSRNTVFGGKAGPGPNSATVWLAPALAIGWLLQVADWAIRPGNGGAVVPVMRMSSISQPGAETAVSALTRNRSRTARPPKPVPRFTEVGRNVGYCVLVPVKPGRPASGLPAAITPL